MKTLDPNGTAYIYHHLSRTRHEQEAILEAFLSDADESGDPLVLQNAKSTAALVRNIARLNACYDEPANLDAK